MFQGWKPKVTAGDEIMMNSRRALNGQKRQSGKWVGAVLSAENRHTLFVPRGFAHGFLPLEDGTEVEYLVDNEYPKENARGVIWNNPKMGVEWPITSPVLSEKDAKLPMLDRAGLFPWRRQPAAFLLSSRH